MKNKQKSEWGKQGADKKWASRYETLIALSGIYGKKRQDEFMKDWPTEHLKQLLAWHNRHK